MIISASYKTDIPAFYGEWFINRLRAGSCKMVNPYGRQVHTINLRREAHDGHDGVDGIVFWTKNMGPLMKHLPEIRDRGYPFAVQHTINGYPRELEARVIDYDRATERMHELAATYPDSRIIWRYDPILITDAMTPEVHKKNFEKLAARLKDATKEVIVSFAQVYKKTRRNLDQAAEEHGFDWGEHKRIAGEGEPADIQALSLITSLADIAYSYQMQLQICSQKRFVVGKATEARCINAEWFGLTYKRHGNREECACSASRDIGEYDTCPHGCVYCYAVQNREKALDRYKRHYPESEFLFEPESQMTRTLPAATLGASKRRRDIAVRPAQQSLFDED